MFVVKGYFKIVLEFRRQNTEFRSYEDFALWPKTPDKSPACRDVAPSTKATKVLRYDESSIFACYILACPKSNIGSVVHRVSEKFLAIK